MSRFASSPEALERLIRQRVEALSYLPTTAAVAMKFIQLGKDPDADPADYCKIISSDSSLSTKLLALANSSWFGVRNKVTRPNVALNLLGLGTVRTLAISYCLTGLHNDLRLTAEQSKRFWSASLCKGVAAKQFARHFDPTLAEEAFAAALFADFAIPIMFSQAKDACLAILDDDSLTGQAMLPRERAVFGIDHAEVGRLVARKLDLPEMFIGAVAFHHDQPKLAQLVEHRPIADAAYVASLFPHFLESWNSGDAAELRSFITSATAEKPLEVETYLESVQKEYGQLYAYFEGGSVPELKLAELLETATREIADGTTRLMGAVHEMMREVASAGKEVHQILTRSSELEEAAMRDALTGALNRDGLAKKGAEVLTAAARYASPFAVVYLDLDNFKDVNDTFGHQAGDDALRRLATIVRNALRPTDLFARMGGDEFVLLMADCPESTAQTLVQRTVDAVAAVATPEATADTPKLTLSAGLLCIPGRGQVIPLDPLLHAADKLMYRAKGAGGNQLYKKTFDVAPKAA